MHCCCWLQLKSMLVTLMALAAIVHIKGTTVWVIIARPDVQLTACWCTSKKSKAVGITGDKNLDLLHVRVQQDNWHRVVQELNTLPQHVPVRFSLDVVLMLCSSCTLRLQPLPVPHGSRASGFWP